MTNQRFTYGIRKGTNKWEIRDKYRQFPLIPPTNHEPTAKTLSEFLNTLEEDTQESQKIGYLLHQQQTKETLQKYLESVILLKKVPGANNLVLTGYIDLIHNIANDLNITLGPIQKP